jgi:hypothetical protein
MIRTFLAVTISFLIFSSCHKIGCDPGMMDQKFDVGFYRPPLMNPIAYYVSVDGGQKNEMPSPETSLSNVSCATTGLLHYSLSLGSHIITISEYGTTGNSHTLILSRNGATLDGTPLQLQSCNNGLSIVLSPV